MENDKCALILMRLRPLQIVNNNINEIIYKSKYLMYT